jgi:hypothetical protein
MSTAALPLNKTSVQVGLSLRARNVVLVIAAFGCGIDPPSAEPSADKPPGAMDDGSAPGASGFGNGSGNPGSGVPDAGGSASVDAIDLTAPESTELQSGRVRIAWMPNARAASYDVAVATDAECKNRLASVSVTTGTETTVAPISPGTRYACVIGSDNANAVVARTATGRRFDVFVGTREFSATNAAARRVQGWSGHDQGRLFVWGGFVPDTRVNRPYEVVGSAAYLNEKANAWTSIAPQGSPAVRGAGAASRLAIVGKTVCTWGGRTTAYFTFEGAAGGGCYDTLSSVWTPMPTLGQPSARTGHFVGAFGTKVVVYGGFNSGGREPQNFLDGAVYDTIGKTWSPIPSTASRGATVMASNRLVTLSDAGGFAYDFLTNTWSPVASPDFPANSVPRRCSWPVVVGNEVASYYFLGASDGAWAFYDVSKNAWRKVPTPRPAAVCEIPAGSDDKRLYVVRGDATKMEIASADPGSATFDVVGSVEPPFSVNVASELRLYWAKTHLVAWDGYRGRAFAIYPSK